MNFERLFNWMLVVGVIGVAIVLTWMRLTGTI